MKKHRTEVLIL